MEGSEEDRINYGEIYSIIICNEVRVEIETLLHERMKTDFAFINLIKRQLFPKSFA